MGTVARTYSELESTGLVVSRRGGGTRVAEGTRLPRSQVRTALRASAHTYVRHARLLGASDQEIRHALAEALEAAPGGV